MSPLNCYRSRRGTSTLRSKPSSIVRLRYWSSRCTLLWEASSVTDSGHCHFRSLTNSQQELYFETPLLNSIMVRLITNVCHESPLSLSIHREWTTFPPLGNIQTSFHQTLKSSKSLIVPRLPVGARWVNSRFGRSSTGTRPFIQKLKTLTIHLDERFPSRDSNNHASFVFSGSSQGITMGDFTQRSFPRYLIASFLTRLL